MTETTPPNWGPCPPGELARLTACLQFQRRLRTAGGVGVALLVAAVLASAGWAIGSTLFGAEPVEPKSDPCQAAPAPLGGGQ